MRPERNFGLAPAEQNVGMMALLFGERADLVDERQRPPEVRELVSAHDVVLADHLPLRRLRQLAMNPGELSSLQRRHAAMAGNTSLVGK